MEFHIVLTYVAVATVSAAMGVQVCPPEEVLFPCKCNETTYEISCVDIREEFNLKEIFDNAAEYVGDDIQFSILTLYNLTALKAIEEGTFEHLKFLEIYIDSHPNLEYISPLAFNESRHVTHQISIQGNEKLGNDPPHERNVFDFVSSFERLAFLFIRSSGISSIPDDAFQNLPNLFSASLSYNPISRIGSRAFATGTNSLRFVYLSDNFISADGLSEGTFDGISTPFYYFDFGCNKLDSMERKTLQPLFDRVEEVSVHSYCWGNPNPPARYHCDERADWICANENRYRGKLRGYLCNNETGFEDIWDYCSGRNGTLPGSVGVNYGAD